MLRGTGRAAAALLLAVTLAGGTGTVGAQAVDLAPTGALRVAVTTNPALATKDPGSGEWRGVWIDLARALAQRLGLAMVIVEYPSDAARDAAADVAWDVASTADTPAQAAASGKPVTIPYLEVDNTLVVGPTSAIRGIADMDRPGVRIAAVNGGPPERTLSGLVQQAEIVRVATNADLAALLASGQVEALASNRLILLGFAAQVPGSRVLADRYAFQEQRITLAPGRAAASLALASAVTRQALATGLIRTSIARAGTVGVQPAAAGAPGGLPRTGGPPPSPTGVAGAGLAAAAVGLLAASRRRPRARFAAAAAARSAREAAQVAGHGAGAGEASPERNRTTPDA